MEANDKIDYAYIIRLEEAINWPYIDSEYVHCFSNREAADNFVTENFAKLKKADDAFVDLKVVEYDLLD